MHHLPLPWSGGHRPSALFQNSIACAMKQTPAIEHIIAIKIFMIVSFIPSPSLSDCQSAALSGIEPDQCA